MLNVDLVQSIKNKLAMVRESIAPYADAPLVLSAGAALAVYGIRDHYDDLDLDIEPKAYQVLLDAQVFPTFPIPNLKDGIRVFEWADIHCRQGWVETVEVEGVLVYTLDCMLQQKLSLLYLPGRSEAKKESDRRDILAIRALIAQKAA